MSLHLRLSYYKIFLKKTNVGGKKRTHKFFKCQTVDKYCGETTLPHKTFFLILQNKLFQKKF